MLKNKYMFGVAVVVLIELFLLIIGNNVPPRITKLGYLWMLSLAFYQPRIYISNTFLIFYFFILLYVFLILYGVYELPFKLLAFQEVFPLILSISIFQYFRNEQDDRALGLLSLVSLVFLGITALITNLVYFKYPLASRELSSMGFSIGSIFYQRSHKLGVADYGLLCGVAFLLPSFIGLLKTESFDKNIKTGLLITLSILVIMLIRSTYTSFVLFSSIGVIFALVGSENFKKSLIILIFSFLVFYFFPRHILSDWIAWAANQFEISLIRDRLIDLSITIDKGVNMSETHFSQRAARIPYLMKNFSESPYAGKGIILTGHVFWLDRLAGFGLVGLVPWALLIFHLGKYYIRQISNKNFYFFIISYVLFLTYGMMKGYGTYNMFAILFFVIPGLGYIKHAFPLRDFFKKKDAIK